MRRANRPSLALCLVALLFAAPVTLHAQFGTKEIANVIPSADFTPSSTGITYFNEGFTYFQVTTGNPAVFLTSLKVPVGAKINQVCAFTRDDDATAEVSLDLAVVELGDTGTSPSVVPLASAGTGGAATPGYKLLCAEPPAGTILHAFADADSSGGAAWLSYRLAVTLKASNNLAFGGGLVKWQRQQAPAPVTATFGDVPTNFIYFRAIENLVATGVTGGCTAGNYCPGANITRGEAAVFFARALGLSAQP